MDATQHPTQDELAGQIARKLHDLHGPMLGGVALAKALGFPTLGALRTARKRGRVSLRIFPLPHTRGSFALTEEVAAWIATQAQGAEAQKPNGGNPM